MTNDYAVLITQLELVIKQLQQLKTQDRVEDEDEYEAWDLLAQVELEDCLTDH